MKYAAFIVKGLEEVNLQEIKDQISDAMIISITPKVIIFDTAISASEVMKLKTIDDIGIFVGQFNISTQEDILQALDTVEWNSYKTLIKNVRYIDPHKFSITVSVNNSNFNSNELIEHLASKLHGNIGNFIADDHSNFDIRFNISERNMIIAVRLTEHALHHRSYKKNYRFGNLRPTIAAAMVYAALGNTKGMKVVDTFCGSGTILCEALQLGHDVYGGDIDNSSVFLTNKNLNNIEQRRFDIRCESAAKTTWASHSFDCAVSNLPWGKQVEVPQMLTLYASAIKEFSRIIKMKGTICLMGIKTDHIASQIKKNFGYRNIKIIKLGHLGQSPSMVIGKAE